MASARAPIVAFIILASCGMGALVMVAATRESAPAPETSAPDDPLAEPLDEPTPTPTPTPAAPPNVTPETLPAAADVISRNRFRFKACFDQALAADAKAQGTVTVTVKLGPAGDVVLSVGESKEAPPAMTSCIAKAFKSMKFPPPEGGSATMVVPIKLKGS